MKFLVRSFYDVSGQVLSFIEEVDDQQSQSPFDSRPCSLDDFISVFDTYPEAESYLARAFRS